MSDRCTSTGQVTVYVSAPFAYGNYSLLNVALCKCWTSCHFARAFSARTEL